MEAKRKKKKERREILGERKRVAVVETKEGDGKQKKQVNR